MRFGIQTMDEFDVRGRTVLCRVDINQPVDRAAGTLRSTKRIEACMPTVRELADKGARVVLLAHQGSDIEYQNYWSTEPHAEVLRRLGTGTSSCWTMCDSWRRSRRCSKRA